MAENEESWDRIAAAYQADVDYPTDTAHYGPGVPLERELRLIGDVAGRRVLELGCGGGQAAVAFVRAGAHTIAIDASAAQLAHARRLADEHGVKIELHHGDLADLAFLRADSVDVAYSAGTFAEVADLDRVFRQVHRVLRPAAMLVFSYEHPMSWCVGRGSPNEQGEPGALLVRRSYFASEPMAIDRHGERFIVHPRTIADVFGALSRAAYRVEVIVEPEPEGTNGPPLVPSTIIWRARKEGV